MTPIWRSGNSYAVVVGGNNAIIGDDELRTLIPPLPAHLPRNLHRIDIDTRFTYLILVTFLRAERFKKIGCYFYYNNNL